MDKLIENGIKFDAIITDPPYGTTACKWDNVIQFDEMWDRIRNIRKNKSPAVIFGSEPFSSNLRMSNIKEYKYDWIWEKEQGANFMLVKYQPYKVHEIVSVFFKHNYYPQMTIGSPYISGGGDSGETTCRVKKIKNKNEGTRFPRSTQCFSTDKCRGSKHPTQKPLLLLEYLIKTYTNEGDLVLDFTCGSGTTLLTAKNLNRRCIGIELEEKYCEIARQRLI